MNNLKFYFILFIIIGYQLDRKINPSSKKNKTFSENLLNLDEKCEANINIIKIISIKSINEIDLPKKSTSNTFIFCTGHHFDLTEMKKYSNCLTIELNNFN